LTVFSFPVFSESGKAADFLSRTFTFIFIALHNICLGNGENEENGKWEIGNVNEQNELQRQQTKINKNINKIVQLPKADAASRVVKMFWSYHFHFISIAFSISIGSTILPLSPLPAPDSAIHQFISI